MTPAKPHVLVVDDEESMRWFLERTLRREGCDVTVAPDGPEAIRAAQANPPDLVLADVRMPGMDGVALLRALRTVIPGVPVILMTAYGAVEDALHAMKQGAVDYVTKPFRVEQIREVVSKVLAGGGVPAPTVRNVGTEDAPTTVPSAGGADAEALPAGGGAGFAPALAVYLRERFRERGLPLPPECASGDLDLRDMARLAETVYVDELLRITEGNVSRAADIAGITRPNLHRKIQDLGLSADAYRA